MKPASDGSKTTELDAFEVCMTNLQQTDRVRRRSLRPGRDWPRRPLLLGRSRGVLTTGLEGYSPSVLVIEIYRTARATPPRPEKPAAMKAVGDPWLM